MIIERHLFCRSLVLAVVTLVVGLASPAWSHHGVQASRDGNRILLSKDVGSREPARELLSSPRACRSGSRSRPADSDADPDAERR